jgi:hypothetical protein
MRTPTKVVVALTLAIGTLSTSAIVAAAGSDTATHRSTGGVFMDPTGGSSDPSHGGSDGSSGSGSAPGDPGDGSSGPIAVDPGVPGPCGVQVSSGTGPDGTVSYTPCPGDDPSNPIPVPMPLDPTPGMDNVHPRGWDTSSVGDDGSTVTLTFYTGVAPCSVLDHVDVAYGTDTVTITLYEGSDPGSRDVACIDIAMLASTTLRLDQPLGDRTIVDGAES